MTEKAQVQEWQDIYFRNKNGVRLHARDYGERTGHELPLVCLPGLTRNAADFHRLAVFLSTHKKQPRRVVALSLRGRGQSEWLKDPNAYTPAIEAQDVIDFIPAAGMTDIILLGTSRGGLVSMMMGPMRPGIIKGVILNDVGPELQQDGIARIKSYVSTMPKYSNWHDVTHALKSFHQNSFPKLTDDDWMEMAKSLFVKKGDLIEADYDPAIGETIEEVDLSKPLPTIWPHFLALKYAPVLAIRGDNSDVLSSEIVKEMAERHGDVEEYVVENEGHAPLLNDNDTQARIAAFLAKIKPHH